ncbi:MAG: MnmA/TRMU family protein, partial [Flavobacteriales bacterium]
EIKFNVFLKEALALGADFVATGHYCRKIIHDDGNHGLLSGLDPEKDQSYFLCQVRQSQLQKALFPIGGLKKAEVRTIALAQGIHTADKKDSQGLCFVGKISLPTFLQQQLAPKQGAVIEIPEDLQQFSDYNAISNTLDHVVALSEPFSYDGSMGEPVTTHQGAHYYTVGQRKGLHIGGRPKPSFVLATDTKENIIYSGQTDEHPGLYHRALRLAKEEVNWIQTPSEAMLETGLECSIRIRYRQPLQKGILIKKEGTLYLWFETPQRGITPGQFAAWYNGDELLGSGVISN